MGVFEVSLSLVVILVLVAFVAGFIDSIAGGGGMLTIPALMLAGLNPLESLATNKLQSSFGSFSAALYYYKKGLILPKHLPKALFVFICGAIGTLIVQNIDVGFLSKAIPVLIFIFGLYFLFSPRISDEDKEKRVSSATLLFILGFVGLYDGMFGPGTGSFFMLVLIALGGVGAMYALGETKLYNFASNLAAVLFFAFGGDILWGLGFAMAIGQFLGANLGARLAVKYGSKIIKPLLVTVSFIMSAKLAYDQWF